MRGSVLALCGGVGGAKLALGLYRVLGPGQLTVVVNTGDDFEHLGLSISPDIDTVLYTLGGVADPSRGWGRANESWHFMTALRDMGGEAWFQLGDRDLAMHVERTRQLRMGAPLSGIVARAARSLGIQADIVPMSDDRVQTVVETDEGTLAFQRYFVEHRCAPAVRGLRFDGADASRPAAGVSDALMSDALHAIVICPSNPYLSIDPILAVPGMRSAIACATAPVIAVSPIIQGQAVKGPTSKIMAELGERAVNRSIAAHYEGLIDGLVIDAADAADAGAIDVPVLATPTLMHDLSDRKRLAAAVLGFAGEVGRTKRSGRRSDAWAEKAAS